MISVRSYIFLDGIAYDMHATQLRVHNYMDTHPMIEQVRALVTSQVADLRIASIPFRSEEFYLCPVDNHWYSGDAWLMRWGVVVENDITDEELHYFLADFDPNASYSDDTPTNSPFDFE